MGIDQRVTFAAAVPAWEAVRTLLAGQGFPLQMRMINGELAFPDEEPSAEWRELRVGTPAGMITVRREPGQVVLVVWGNADGPLIQAWNALAWAFAEAGDGRVITGEEVRSAADFRRAADLPPALSG